jgi:hypothetical protein
MLVTVADAVPVEATVSWTNWSRQAAPPVQPTYPVGAVLWRMT